MSVGTLVIDAIGVVCGIAAIILNIRLMVIRKRRGY